MIPGSKPLSKRNLCPDGQALMKFQWVLLSFLLIVVNTYPVYMSFPHMTILKPIGNFAVLPLLKVYLVFKRIPNQYMVVWSHQDDIFTPVLKYFYNEGRHTNQLLVTWCLLSSWLSITSLFCCFLHQSWQFTFFHNVVSVMFLATHSVRLKLYPLETTLHPPS